MTAAAPTGYTDDEIVASISSMVLSSISRPIDTLGVRRTDVTFSDVQEAAAGVFLLIQEAPFYVAFLGAQRVLETISAEADLLSQLIASIQATGRKVFPIDDITPLSNATAALLNLQAAVGQRSQNFKSINQVPAFQQFQQNVTQFLATAGSNIKSQGQIVQTPQEARTNIPSLVSQIQSSHLAIVANAILLAGAMDDYASLNLPAVAAQGVISRAQQVLQGHEETLTTLSPTDRLSVIRPIILDLLSSSTIVEQYGSLLAPSSFYALTGTGAPFSDANHAANSGSATGSIVGPWAISATTNELDVWLDSPATAKLSGTVDSITLVTILGELFPYKALFNRAAGSFITDGIAVNDIVYVKSGPNLGVRYIVTQVLANALSGTGNVLTSADAGPVTVEVWRSPDESVGLASSYVGQSDGSIREPFLVTTDNQSLTFSVDTTPITTSLTLGSQTAAQVAASINAAISSASLSSVVQASAFLSPLEYDGIVDVSVTGPTATFTVQAGQLDGLISVGDQVLVLSGANAGQVFTIASLGPSPILFFTALAGSAVTASGERVQIGSPGFKVRLSFVDPQSAVETRKVLTIDSSPASAGAVLLLGFASGAAFVSKPTSGQVLVADYNSKAQKSFASIVSVPLTNATLARTKPEDNRLGVLYRFRGTADVTALTHQVSLVVSSGGLLASGAIVGDTLVLRTGSDPDSIWTITVLTDTTLTATGTITTSTATGLTIEIGPTLSIVPGLLFTVVSGPNIGNYYIRAAQTIPFEFQIETVFPSYKDGFSNPVFLTGTSLVQESFQISSNDKTTISQVTVNGSAAQLFNATVPYSGHGTTPWFKLPSVPPSLRAGDFLDIYQSDPNTPTDSFLIRTIENANLLIQLDHPIDSLVSWSFNAQPPPFARLRSGQVFDFNALQAALDTWSSNPINQAAFFTDLNRFLNPLLVNQNPTDDQVQSALTKVKSLAGLLSLSGAATSNADPSLTLEFILGEYHVDVVTQVDSLVKTYTDKGSDKAIDTLVSGQFSVFFGLDEQNSSYAGALQSAIASVAMNDLAIRKTNRDEASSSPLQATLDNPDPEYVDASADQVQVDPAQTIDRS